MNLKSADERQRYFLAYCDVQTISHVMKTCKITQVTAYKYAKLDQWEKRYLRIKKKVITRLDRKLADRTALNIDKVDTLKKKVYDALIDPDNSSLTVDKVGIKDFDKLVRLEELLLGKPDARTENLLSELKPEDRRAIIDFLEGRGTSAES